MKGVRRKEISVIIPCFNCERTIGETLDSLLRQSFKNFTVICVEDGSTDNTPVILQKWIQNNILDLVVINQKNSGVSASRNVGIKACNTKYITFLDSDDIFHRDFLNDLFYAAERNKADTAFCLLTRDRDVFDHSKKKNTVELKTREQAMNDLLYKMGQIGFVCFMYSAEIVSKNNLLFASNTKYGEDREFNWKYLCHARRISFVNDNLYFYRINDFSATKTKPHWDRTDSIEAMVRVCAYMKTMQTPFLKRFKSFMVPRTMWSVAKDYSLFGDRLLFSRLITTYAIRKEIAKLVFQKKAGFLVSISSLLFCIHPFIFFKIINHYGNHKQ